MIDPTTNTIKIKSVRLIRKGPQWIYKIIVFDDYDEYNLKVVKQDDLYIVTDRHFTDYQLSRKCDHLLTFNSGRYYVGKGPKRDIMKNANEIIKRQHEDYVNRKLKYKVRLEGSDPEEVYALNDTFFRWEIEDTLNSNMPDKDYEKVIIDEAKANRRHLSLVDGKRDWQNIPHSVAFGKFFGQNYVLINTWFGAPGPSEYYHKRRNKNKKKTKK